MSDNTFVSLNEINRLALEMLNSEWWDNAVMQTVDPSKDFVRGAMWGAAIAMVYVTANSNKYYPTVVPGSRNEEITEEKKG